MDIAGELGDQERLAPRPLGEVVKSSTLWLILETIVISWFCDSGHSYILFAV